MGGFSFSNFRNRFRYKLHCHHRMTRAFSNNRLDMKKTHLKKTKKIESPVCTMIVTYTIRYRLINQMTNTNKFIHTQAYCEFFPRSSIGRGIDEQWSVWFARFDALCQWPAILERD